MQQQRKQTLIHGLLTPQSGIRIPAAAAVDSERTVLFPATSPENVLEPFAPDLREAQHANALSAAEPHEEAPASVTDVDVREPPTEPHIAVADPFEIDAQLADIGESAARADQVDDAEAAFFASAPRDTPQMMLVVDSPPPPSARTLCSVGVAPPRVPSPRELRQRRHDLTFVGKRPVAPRFDAQRRWFLWLSELVFAAVCRLGLLFRRSRRPLREENI